MGRNTSRSALPQVGQALVKGCPTWSPQAGFHAIFAFTFGAFKDALSRYRCRSGGGLGEGSRTTDFESQNLHDFLIFAGFSGFVKIVPLGPNPIVRDQQIRQ